MVLAMAKELNAPNAKAAEGARAISAEVGGAGFGFVGGGLRAFWAVVETGGPLVRGRSGARVPRVEAGNYEVVFTSDVSEGVYVATMGRPGIATEPAGTIGVALRCCLEGPEENKGVWVDTHDLDGSFADRAFHLIVHVH